MGLLILANNRFKLALVVWFKILGSSVMVPQKFQTTIMLLKYLNGYDNQN